MLTMISLTNAEEYVAIKNTVKNPWFYGVFAFLCGWAVWENGFLPPSVALFALVLVTISLVDLKKQIIPDAVLVPATFAGLFLSHLPPEMAAFGGLVGFALFALIFWGSFKLTGRYGMGFGDVKMLAMLGVWLGPFGLPLVLLLSTFSASFFAAYYLIKGQRQQRISFGPFLAFGGWVTLLYGENIWYILHSHLQF